MAGGVGIYLKNTLKYSPRNDLSLKTPNCEDLWIEVESETSNFCLGVVYRHPKKNFSLFQNKLYLQLHDFETNNMNYVVCGNFNINTLLNNPTISEYIIIIIKGRWCQRRLTRFNPHFASRFIFSFATTDFIVVFSLPKTFFRRAW